ncbi:MAG: hypothetical protein WAV93_09845 [Bacteroidales bacterium]
MRRSTYIFGILLLLFAAISCNDDFLARNDAEQYNLSDTLFITSYDYLVDLTFELPERIKSDFTVFMHPRWLTFPSPHGSVSNGTVELAFSVDETILPMGYASYLGNVILDITDYGFVSFTVVFTNFGTPTLNCSPSEIVFDRTYSGTFYLSTSTDGLLVWEIPEIPGWLTFSKTSGVLLQGQDEAITVNMNAGMITPETDTDVNVRISGNSVTGDFLLRVRVTPETALPTRYISLKGIVTDAEFHHETGLMAICTRSPNSLILLRTASGESDTISLGKTPGCISISEDGHRAVLGYQETSVGYVNLDTGEIISEYTPDCIPFDIVLGGNGWCYVSPATDQWEVLRNLNLNTGEIVSNLRYSDFYEKTIIRKVPGKPIIAGTRSTLSPSGLLLFSITGEGPVNDTISYYHEDMGNLWVSADGSRLYGASGKVYDLPAYDTESHSTLPPSGQLNMELSFISAFDECPAASTIFVTTSHYHFLAGFSSNIEMFNTVSLEKTRSLSVAPIVSNENGTWVSHETSPHYLFVNKEGSVLFALKTLKYGSTQDTWYLETINLD